MTRTACLVLVAALCACASHAPPPPSVPAAEKAPEGCTKDYPANAPLLKLDPTRTPKDEAKKNQPFQFASELKVKDDLLDKGAWTDFNDGWSMLALRISSANAKTIALHLVKLELPPRTQIWLCSTDNHFRLGPYRDATGGELWTPVVVGSEAKLQVDVPTADRGKFKGELAEAYGGFR